MTYPDDHDYQSLQWDAAADRRKLLRRGSLLLWFIGGVQTVFFGWFTISLLVMANIPEEVLREQLFERQPPDTVEQLMQFHPAFSIMAATVFFLGALPGVTYIVLGFLVRRGRSGAINFAALILITQAIVVGVLLLANVVAGVMEMNPAFVTVNILVFGTPLAILAYVVISLLRARRAVLQPDPYDEHEPWDREM